MTYYPDLSLKQFSRKDKENYYCILVGWLDIQHPFNRGPVDDDFLRKLWIFCRQLINEERGFHDCELCERPPSWPPVTQRGRDTLCLGSAEIRVFGKAGEVFAAPNLIYHYIAIHNYLPPIEFIKSVMSCPPPESEEYQSMAKSYDWDIYWEMCHNDRIKLSYHFIDLSKQVLTKKAFSNEAGISEIETEFYRRVSGYEKGSDLMNEKKSGPLTDIFSEICHRLIRNMNQYWKFTTDDQLIDLVRKVLQEKYGG